MLRSSAVARETYAALRAFTTNGNIIVAKIPIIEITTKSSTSVNPKSPWGSRLNRRAFLWRETTAQTITTDMPPTTGTLSPCGKTPSHCEVATYTGMQTYVADMMRPIELIGYQPGNSFFGISSIV